MNTIPTDPDNNELVERSVESATESTPADLGDDTSEIPKALMDKLLNS